MNSKVQNAVNHLNKILPLAERKQKLSPEIANVYQRILNSYIEPGRTLNKKGNAEQIEGKVNGQQIVILTKFVKKSN